MVNTGTYVKLLRHLGIALIFAPEPFTTPFGVAFILAARHLSKQHEVAVNNRLREMVQYYLAHSSLLSHDAEDKSDTPDPVKRHALTEERPILGHITGSGGFAANSSVRKGRHDMQEGEANPTTDMQGLSRLYKYGNALSDTSTGTQKVIHHTIDIGWLSQRYESASTAVAHASWTTTSPSMQGVTHHSVNMGPLSQHYRTGGNGRVKEKAHATNIAQHRQRLGPVASCATVYRALQNNYYYYYYDDTLSRRNVIGVY
jgi:hypothetical protein